MQRKYIFITGGVVSSLGKGQTMASLAMLLEKKGFKIALLKLDPYLNVDPGTMNPFEHGEVYVTDDGSETDLDLGHYYRYTLSPLSKHSTATSGQIYDAVIKKEREGAYLGKTVQVIPHITDEIKRRLISCGEQAKADIVLVEIGGTIGDIESLPFLEAIRQFCYENPKQCLNIHLTYVPYLSAAGEIKTKPTQHSVQNLRSIGILPDMIICRSTSPLSTEIKHKISLFCSVPIESVFDETDVETTVYEIPIKLRDQGVDKRVCQLLGLEDKPTDLKEWKHFVEKIYHPKGSLKIGIAGKYLQHKDAYKSVFEALNHAAIKEGYQLKLAMIESDKISSETSLKECDGYLVPGGFGERGWEGKIAVAQYCRENRIPYFGICLGMQVLVVEFARNVMQLSRANSTEMDPHTPAPIISLLEEQKQVQQMGGSMRLGAFPCSLKKGSRVHKAYGKDTIYERHRHRYEFNNAYKETSEKHGLFISGICTEKDLCEIVEVKNHPWMVGVQFHPEFKSRPITSQPLFHDFVKAIIASRSNEKN